LVAPGGRFGLLIRLRLGVFVGRLVLSDLCHIFDSVFEDLASVGA